MKNPGGEIAIWSLLWILAGSFITYTTFAAGKTGLGVVFALLPIGCALIWFDVRPAKWLVVAYLGIATVGALGMMVANGFSLSLLARGGVAAYSAFIFARWNGGPNADTLV